MSELIDRWAQGLADTSIGSTIGSSDYLFPFLESVHVVGVALVIGTIWMVDLRMLGIASRGRTVREITAHLLPVTWAGFVVALISGALLFMSNAPTYVNNRAFQLKILVLVIAGANMRAFHRLTYRSIDTWDAAASPPTTVKVAGAVSLVSWVVIVVLGRWIGFL